MYCRHRFRVLERDVSFSPLLPRLKAQVGDQVEDTERTPNYNMVLIVPPKHYPPVFHLLQPGFRSPFPSGSVFGRQMLARVRAKRLATRDAVDLFWSRRENSSLLITFILVLSTSFSFRLRVICKRRVADPSENSWLISDTAAFASASIMYESFSSKVEPHGDMFINKFYSVVDKTPQSITLALQQNLMWFGKDARTIITCGFPFNMHLANYIAL